MATARERLDYLRGLKAQQSGMETPRQKLERLRAEKTKQFESMPKEQQAQQLMQNRPADVPLPAGFEDYDTRGIKAQKHDYSLGEKALGVGETALTALTGMTGGTLGTIYGTGKGIIESVAEGTYGTQEGVRNVEQEAMEQASKLTYQPRTEAGQEYTQELAEIAQPLQAIPSVQGELMALSSFAKPALRQVSVEVPRIAKVMLKDNLADDLKAAQANPQIGKSIKDMALGVDSGDISPKALPALIKADEKNLISQIGKGAYEKIINAADDIAKGNTEASKDLAMIGSDIGKSAASNKLVKYMLNGAGKAEKDPAAINATKNGYDAGIVTAIRGSTPQDKSKMMKMTNMMQEIVENRRKGEDFRPSNVAGDSLLERYNFVANVNKAAGDKLDDVAKNLKGKYADFNGPINNFINKLENMGVKLDENLTPIFKDSDIEGFKPAEFAVTKIVNRLKAGELGKTPSAYDMHRLKKFIDNNVDYGVEGTGLTGDVERAVKALRHDVDSVLDNNFDKYNKVNTQYSDTISHASLIILA